MSGGGSSGSGSSTFRRQGTVDTSTWRDLTAEHHGKFDQAFNAVDPGNQQATNEYLSQVLGMPQDTGIYNDELDQMIQSNLPGQTLPGQSSLQQTADMNPYSNDFRNNTYDQYLGDVNRLLSDVESGPLATRGGTAQTSFMQSDALSRASENREGVIAQHQQGAAQSQQGAAQLLNSMGNQNEQMGMAGIDLARKGFNDMIPLQTQAAGLSSERAKMFADLVPTFTTLDSVMKGLEDNNLYGQGAQSSSSVGMGVNLCCFIFLEAYNGQMPWWVRDCRDEFAPENTDRRWGYISMSRWLVPAMKKSKVVRWLTDKFMIKPLTIWGGYHKGVKGYKLGWLCKPYVTTWFKIWEQIGKAQIK